MENIGYYVFNRGGTISVNKGPKSYEVVVLDGCGKEFVRRFFRGRDKGKLILRAMAVLKKNQFSPTLVLYESEGESFPFKVRTEQDELDDFTSSIPVQDIIKGARLNIWKDKNKLL